MPASMTIHLLEDDDPNGSVLVDWEIDGFEMREDTKDADLPPAVLLGGKMIELTKDLLAPGEGHSQVTTLRLFYQGD